MTGVLDPTSARYRRCSEPSCMPDAGIPSSLPRRLLTVFVSPFETCEWAKINTIISSETSKLPRPLGITLKAKIPAEGERNISR